MTWTPPRASGRLTDDEQALILFARQLGLGHMLVPIGYATRAPAGQLLLELLWRARHAFRSLFRRWPRSAPSPDVRKMRDELYQARVANLKEIEAKEPDLFRAYQHRHGEYLARFAR